MRTEQPRIKPNAANPFGHEAGILACGHAMSTLSAARWVSLVCQTWLTTKRASGPRRIRPPLLLKCPEVVLALVAAFPLSARLLGLRPLVACGLHGRVPPDFRLQLNDIKKHVSLTAQLVGDHRRMCGYGGDHGDPDAPALHSLDQCTEVAVTRK